MAHTNTQYSSQWLKYSTRHYYKQKNKNKSGSKATKLNHIFSFSRWTVEVSDPQPTGGQPWCSPQATDHSRAQWHYLTCFHGLVREQWQHSNFFYSGLMWVTRKHRPEYGWTEKSTESQGGLEDTNTQGRALHRTGSFGLAGSSDSVNSTGSCSTFVAEVTQFGWNTHTNKHTRWPNTLTQTQPGQC